MGKMQNVSFRSVEEFLDYLPDNERQIVDLLREVIQDCIPECREKLAYNVPYFYRHKRICFIWPASVPWGNVKQDGVLLGFCDGNLLHDEIGYLDKGNRKQVYTKTFFSPADIDIDLIKTYLFEAVELDELKKR